MQRVAGQPHAEPLCLALMACLIVLAGGGCGAGASSRPSGGTGGIVTHTASATSPAGGDHHLTVSVTCAPGEHLLAGGYAVVNVFESDYSLHSTYPSADATWTVGTESGCPTTSTPWSIASPTDHR
jgi:hypothetical protein